MDSIRFITNIFIISCIPLIHYALSKNINLKDIKKARWHYIAVFIFMSLLTFIGSNGSGESFLAVIISLFVYVFTYKRLIKNKYQPRIADFESFDEYVAALAKKRNIKYPLSQNIIAMFGEIPKLENFESIPEWVHAINKYFDDIESI
ncbi:hypothetical protein [Acinetobacter sp. SA01]|uniref:hypothetical protein n=1 Tax=Acinetobacter sp. SA01 TaxID=1862567 RepID=UPI00140DB580|nr:hypothetical protein [Acinetobacter sp. SA01]